MNKLFIKIAKIFLGLSMAAGVGVAVSSGRKASEPVRAADGVTVTYTVQSKTSASRTSGTAPSGASVSYTQTYGTAKQATNGNSMTMTISGFDGCTITGLSVSVHSNASGGKGSLSFKSGSNTIASIAAANFNTASWNGSYTNSYVSKSVTCTSTVVGSGEDLVLVIACPSGKSNNSMYFEAATLTYNEPATTTPSVSLDKASVDLTVGGTSSSVVATPSNITNPTYSWATVSGGDDCVTLTNASSATVTIAPKGTTFGTCTVRLTVNGTNGGSSITPITKDVAVSVNKVPSQTTPYTVAEAIYAIDNNKTVSGVFVRGIVSKVDSFASGAITYWISDDGTTTNQFEVYKGKDANGNSFSSIGDVLVGDIVVVSGSITLYNSSTYEFNSGSYRVSYSRVTVDSIAVKTAPTKTAYISGEDFEPAGLVIAVTFTDESTEDVPYSGNEAKFTFSESKITSAGNVTITYGGQTCTQAVTLLTVKSVTGVHSHPEFVYKDGSIDGDDVELDVLYSDDETTGVVHADHVDVDTSAVAPSVLATAYYDAGETLGSTFYVEVKKVPAYVYLDDSLTLGDFTGVTSATYANTTNIAKTSDARYSANTNDPNDSDDSTKLRYSLRTSNNNSGIVSTTSGGLVYSVTVNEVYYTASGTRTLDIYGSNTAYTDPTDLYDANKQGTKLASLSNSTKSYTFTDDYAYVGLRSSSGAIMMQEITIAWKVEDAENPLVENPVLSTGNSASVNVGKNLSLSVTTNPIDSDEKLVVTSSNTSYATVSGTGRNFVIHGVAIGSARVTVAGSKGTYSSYVDVTVTEATKTYEDKYLTANSLGITSYDTDTTHTYENDGVSYTCYNIMKNNGLQFKSGAGYLTNTESLYSTGAKIKSVTLFLHSGQSGTAGVYEGTSASPDSEVSASVTTGDVVSYQFSSNMTHFMVASTSGTLNIDEIIVELVNDTNSVLEEARTAASTILNALKNTCGADNSGVVTQSQWDSLNSSLTALTLSDDAKLFLKESRRISLDNLLQGSVTIENAMAHYDACVTKFGFTPFTGITSAKASARVTPIFGITQSSNTVAIIVIISMVSVTAIGGYFFLRKRREQY